MEDTQSQVENQDGSQGSPATEASAPENMIPGPLAPLPSPVDFTKPVRTKGSHGLKSPVRILAIDYSLSKPIIGVIMDGGNFCRQASVWEANGQYDSRTSGDCLDLENVPAPSSTEARR